jgi:predicted acetyltransferase
MKERWYSETTILSHDRTTFDLKGALYPMPFVTRSITPDEYPKFWHAIHIPFGERPTERSLEIWRTACEFDRTLVTVDPEDGDRFVATAGAYSLELTLPGGALLPAAGVTWVGVLPTHRRQGLLTALMRRQLDDVSDRGEALAILNASESSIYARFGYGQASEATVLEIDRQHTAFAHRSLVSPARGSSELAPGRVRVIDHEEALGLLPAVYDRVRRLQPGAVSRIPEYWTSSLQDPYEPVDGFGPRYYVSYVSSASGTVDGAAHYRIKPYWDQGFPAHTLEVNELLAVTPSAYTELWRYLLSLDLVQTIRVLRRPVDEPVRWQLADPRRLRPTRITDELWVRLLDIEAALSARSYRTYDRLLFDVTDTFRPQVAGRYLLEVGQSGAGCHRTASDTGTHADLTLDISDLSSTYLGGVSFSTLGRAGRVTEETPGALTRADLLFSTDRAPYCGTPF